MKEVAAAADVSVATVSCVLSGSLVVTSEAEQAVRRAAEKLGYRRNSVASALRTNGTATIGMVVPDLENPSFPSVVKAWTWRCRTPAPTCCSATRRTTW